MAVAQRRRADLGRLLGAAPRRDASGRRRDWHGAWTALERLADHHRHRDDRHRPQERPGRLRDRDSGRVEHEEFIESVTADRVPEILARFK